MEKQALFRCSSCQKQGSSSDVKACAVCGTVRYCSVECQKGDWSQHKASCTKAAAKQLFAAIDRSDADTVRRLAKIKRVLNARVDYMAESCDHGEEMLLRKWTPLHHCVRMRNVEMMEILLHRPDCNIEIVDGDGETALFCASNSFGGLPVLRTLLNAMANPNFRMSDGWTCLMMAVREGIYDNAKELLDNGANPHVRERMFGRSAIDMAAHFMSGQAMSFHDGESYERALAKFTRLHRLLQHYE